MPKRDILTMRDVAQVLEVRNAYIEPDPEWDWNRARPASEVFDQYATPDFDHHPLCEEFHLGSCMIKENEQSVNRCVCGNLLTIADRYNRCRECMLAI